VIRELSCIVATLILATPNIGVAGPNPQAALVKEHSRVYSIRAKQEFNRGLLYLFAFNEAEARQIFASAEAHDPSDPLPYVFHGLSFVLDTNQPTTVYAEQQARDDVQVMQRRASPKTRLEKLWYDAAVKRFVAENPDAGWSALADQLAAHADDTRDATVATVEAYALYHLRRSAAASGRIRRLLNTAVTLDPKNVGARHLRIHFAIRSGDPPDITDAVFFSKLDVALGCSHLLHMPSHVFVRTGEYGKSILANQRAIANDEQYFALGRSPGQRAMLDYHDHLIEFLAYSSIAIGDKQKAFRSLYSTHDTTLASRLLIRLGKWFDAIGSANGDPFVTAYGLAKVRQARLSESVAKSFLANADVNGITEVEQHLLRAELKHLRKDEHSRLSELFRAYRGWLKLNDEIEPMWWCSPGEEYAYALRSQHRYGEALRVLRTIDARYPKQRSVRSAIVATERDTPTSAHDRIGDRYHVSIRVGFFSRSRTVDDDVPRVRFEKRDDVVGGVE